VTKGINKYFMAENPAAPIKNNNVRLTLQLTARNGAVEIVARVLDKDDGNRVLWEKSFIDTTAEDVLSDGKDNPAAPFIGMPGNFVLYLYADGGKDPAGYQVVYDNAETFVINFRRPSISPCLSRCNESKLFRTIESTNFNRLHNFSGLNRNRRSKLHINGSQSFFWKKACATLSGKKCFPCAWYISTEWGGCT